MNEDRTKRPASAVNARRIRRTVIIFIFTVIAIYTAVAVTENKINYHYGEVQDNFSPWIPALAAVLALAAYALVSIFIKRAKAKKVIEARQMEEMLNTPLQKFSDKDDKAEKLANNYDGDPGNDVKL